MKNFLLMPLYIARDEHSLCKRNHLHVEVTVFTDSLLDSRVSTFLPRMSPAFWGCLSRFREAALKTRLYVEQQWLWGPRLCVYHLLQRKKPQAGEKRSGLSESWVQGVFNWWQTIHWEAIIQSFEMKGKQINIKIIHMCFWFKQIILLSISDSAIRDIVTKEMTIIIIWSGQLSPRSYTLIS